MGLKRIGIYEFVRKHRATIDEVIDRHYPKSLPRYDDHYRRKWVLNHYELYQLWRAEGGTEDELGPERPADG